MKLHKRAMISLTRNLIKTMITFFLILAIGLLIGSGFLINEAIYQTENSLKSRVLPIATLTTDTDALALETEIWGAGNFEFQYMLNRELLDQIGSLPHVREFDYAVFSHFLFSEELRNPDIREVYLDAGFSDWEVDDLFRNWPPVLFTEPEYDLLELFTVKGVRNPDILDLRSGSMQLIEGRTFIEEEIRLGIGVAVIPERFAEENQLSIGDIFVLNSFFPSFIGPIYEKVELEVVGIFEVLVEPTIYDWVAARNYLSFNQQIYVPISIARNSLTFRDTFLESATEDEILEAFGSDFFSFEVAPLAAEYQNVLFVFDDFSYIYGFRTIVTEMLPEFWIVDDFYHEIERVSTIFRDMRSIADGISITASLVSLSLLSLTLMLFFYDRRYEINVYNAIGEKSKNIVLQFMTETLLIFHVAFVCFMIASYFISSEISLQLVYNEWVNAQPEITVISLGRVNDLNLMGFGFIPTLEDVLASHHFSLGLLNTLKIYFSSIIIVMMTTLIAIMFVLKKQKLV
ncbi:MAG: ABC transporter permease [Defluviitaleaceae bacterium]|nr:ABC transporter permease [Defluviitaleaceae bacterium]